MDIKNFKAFIKAVGTGPKGNRDLSYQESREMMHQLLQHKVHPENIAAFLLGWRLKPETNEEFCGALEALDTYTRYQKVENSIELGYPFDGKAKNPYLLSLIAKKLLNSDINLVVTGDRLQPAKDGVTTQDLFKNSNFEKNIYYFDRKEYCNELSLLTDIRQRLMLRTGINTIEKLPNVGESEYGITGVHHKPYVAKYQAIFAKRYKRFALIQGNEGSPEIFHKGTLWMSENGKTSEYFIDPSHYGVSLSKATQALSLEASLDIINNPTLELQKLATLNAAIILFITQRAPTIDDAYQSLESL